MRALVAVVITTIQKPRNFLAVVFTKVARAVLQNYHYAAQVLNAVTGRLRPAIKHLRGSLHSNPTPPPPPLPPSPFPLHYACRYVFAFVEILKLDLCEKPK